MKIGLINAQSLIPPFIWKKNLLIITNIIFKLKLPGAKENLLILPPLPKPSFPHTPILRFALNVLRSINWSLYNIKKKREYPGSPLRPRWSVAQTKG